MGEIEESAIAKHQVKKNPRPRPREFDAEKIRKDLESILYNSAEAAPSLEEVARQLGFGSRHLRSQFPELCRAIADKHRAKSTFTEKVRTVEGIAEVKTVEKHLRRFDSEAIRKELESFLLIEETTPPSLKEASGKLATRRACCASTSRTFAGLFRHAIKKL